jgi:hypothetical protein
VTRRLLAYFTFGLVSLAAVSLGNGLGNPAWQSKLWWMLAAGHLLRWVLVQWFVWKPSRNGLIWITTFLPSPLLLALLQAADSVMGHQYVSIVASEALALLLVILLPHFGSSGENSKPGDRQVADHSPYFERSRSVDSPVPRIDISRESAVAVVEPRRSKDKACPSA